MAALSILINEDITFFNFLLLIGCCVLLIKSPSVLRNMWYSTGSGRGMMGQWEEHPNLQLVDFY
ncbi:hypothetical protein [Bacillus cereus]|uniref:hypothetical protein n=1 Tax=Bacillus cereus TaxID=1396 RepID=UPI003C12B7D9